MQKYNETMQRIINFDYITKENTNEHNPSWPKVADLPYRILIIGSSVSGKTNSFFILISVPARINNFYLYVKDAY